MKREKSNQAGAAALEAAIVMLSFLTLLSLALPVVDYIQVTETLSQLVDRHLYDQVVRPFSLSREGTLEVREERIISALSSVLDNANSEMLKAFGEYSDRYYLIEGGCFLVSIDPESGKTRALKAVSGCTDLRQGMGLADGNTPSLASLAAVRFPIGVSAGTYLVPSADYNFNEKTKNGKKLWTGRAAALGIKVSYSFDKSWTASTLQFLGVLDSPVISAFKIIPLRGEVQ